MITVEFKLMLKDMTGKEETSVETNGDVALPELSALLGLSHDVVGMLFINGSWARLDSVIHDGDNVRLYPDVEGG